MKILVFSPTIRRKEMSAVLSVLVEEKIGPGEQAAALVQTAKEALRFDYSLALRSPVSALHTALKLFKSGGEEIESQSQAESQARAEREAPAEVPRDGVLVSALAPLYYHYVIRDSGFIPVFYDVNESTACPDASLIQTAIDRVAADSANPKIIPRCILLDETLGLMPDAEEITQIELPVIEDCSLSYGSLLNGKPAGTFGRYGILSLEERDVLTAGGGALLFSNERRNSPPLRSFASLPSEYALPDMNAAMALTQFREAVRNMEKRNEIARIYTEAAMRGRHKVFVRGEGFTYNNYAFPLLLETGMKDVFAYAKKKEIELASAFERTLIACGIAPKELCPVSYSLSLRTALFPLYPRLGQANAEKVARLIQTLP